MNWTKRWMVVAGVLAPVIVFGALKVWSTGEVVQASDLNANFAYLDSVMVGQHGPRLVNADVSSSAAIAFSKLQTPPLIPKAWGTSSAASSCDGNDTTTNCLTAGSGITSIKGTVSTGLYTITLTNPLTPPYGTVVVPNTTGAATSCQRSGSSSTTVNVTCTNAAGTPTNSNFTAIVMGN